MDSIFKGLFYLFIGLLVMFGIFLFSIIGKFIVFIFVIGAIGWLVSEILGFDKFIERKLKK